jgi:molecular chaperone Hsp33
MEAESSFVQIQSRYVRTRNALLLTGNFAEFFVDYYLHWMDLGLRLDVALDNVLKDALAALTLHLTARPWQEGIAWTVNFQEPLANLFVTGDSFSESVVGRIFTEDVRTAERTLFYSNVTRKGQPPRQSIIEFTGLDFLNIAEQFYAQSEQIPARFFRLPEDEYALLVAQPACDEEWLAALKLEDVAELGTAETLSLMETRRFRYFCGCSVARILPAVEPLARRGLDDLFEGEETLRITCPRCARRYRVSREQVEAFLETTNDNDASPA